MSYYFMEELKAQVYDVMNRTLFKNCRKTKIPKQQQAA